MKSKITRVALVLFLIAGWNIPATTGKAASFEGMNVSNLFNTGLNAGWLQMAVDNNVYSDYWLKYSSDAAAEINTAYSHPPWSPPPIRMMDVATWFLQVKMTVGDVAMSSSDRCTRLATRIMDAGFYLGRAQIYAGIGDCPGCVRNEMQLAGIELRAISPCISVSESVGVSLLETARSIGSREPSARFTSFYAAIDGAIKAIQGSLFKYMAGGSTAGGGTAGGGGTSNLTTGSVWRTRQVHTEGDWRGKVVDVDIEVTTSGNETTMRFGEYVLRGQMRGDVFTFQTFSSRGHHGHGQFTFSGNAFSGTWSDNWAKAGTWVGQRIR